MKLLPLTIPGAYRLTPEVHQDSRGNFTRLFDQKVFTEHGLCTTWRQEATSLNLRAGIVRGLHWQEHPESETKLVRCEQGSIFDVLVDLRPESPMFRRWESVHLSGATQGALYIPEGCAHGFQALEDGCVVHYLISKLFVAELQRGLRWDDPELAISWPRPDAIEVSTRDAALPSLEHALRNRT